MPAFVKTARDERLWKEAKQIVRDEYSVKVGSKPYWALVNRIFHRMKRRVGGGEYSPPKRNPKRKKYKYKTKKYKTNWLMWGGIALGVLILIMVLKKKAAAEPAAIPPGATPAPPTTETLPPDAVPIEGFYADESPYIKVR